jgi:hypothetical protein
MAHLKEHLLIFQGNAAAAFASRQKNAFPLALS